MEPEDPEATWRDYYQRKKAQRLEEAAILWRQMSAAGVSEDAMCLMSPPANQPILSARSALVGALAHRKRRAARRTPRPETAFGNRHPASAHCQSA